MSSNDRHPEDAPLTDAELDLLSAIDAARTPGRLIAVSPRSPEGGQAIAHTGATWDRQWDSPRHTSIRSLLPTLRTYAATTPEQAEADARAIVAAVNALPLLLAEVRRARASHPFGLGPESYTIGPASPEMRKLYGPKRKASK